MKERPTPIEVMDLIAADMERDATNLDGQPFNGQTVAAQFGNQCAAIKALALTVKEVLLRDQPKETWLDRLKAEKDELKEKITKLSEFNGKGKFMELPEIDRSLLTQQLLVMGEYYRILRQRLDRAQA